MVQIIEENKKPSFRQQLGAGARDIMSQLKELGEERKLSKEMPDISRLPKEFQKMAYEAQLKQQQEAEKLRGQTQQNEQLIRAIEQQRGLEPGSLQGFVNNPQLAANISKPSAEKNPLGGLSGQPTPPEISSEIEKVLQENPNATADQLSLAMDKANIPRAYSKDYIESRRQETKPVFEPESEKLEAKRQAETADRIVKGYNAAQTENMRLNKQEALMKSGKLSTPLMVKTLESFGLPLSVLGNPATEEYSKVEADYVRDVSSIFPGAIRNFEIVSYMKTIPSLMNSPKGQEAIIRNRKLLNEAKLMEYNAYKDILKENNGKRPPNMDVMIEERIGPQRAALAEEFRESINTESEKFENKFKMVGPNGKKANIPASKLEAAIKDGFQFQ